MSATQIVARLFNPPLARIAGAPTSWCRRRICGSAGGESNAEYQYTLQSDDSTTLYEWVPKIVAALQKDHALLDVNSDLQQGGLETNIVIDRSQCLAFWHFTPSEIDATLYDAFGQRSASTIYNQLNQYEVVMELAQRYQQTPEDLRRIYVSTSGAVQARNGHDEPGGGKRDDYLALCKPQRKQRHQRRGGGRNQGRGGRQRHQRGDQLDCNRRQRRHLQRHRGEYDSRKPWCRRWLLRRIRWAPHRLP